MSAADVPVDVDAPVGGVAGGGGAAGLAAALLPAVPGLRSLRGTGVLHCPFCHGYEVRRQHVGVLGS